VVLVVVVMVRRRRMTEKKTTTLMPTINQHAILFLNRIKILFSGSTAQFRT